MSSRAAVSLIREGYRARRDDRMADAHRDFTAAVALCRKEGGRRDLIPALKGLAQIQLDMGRSESAQKLYEEAVALCRLEDDALLLAHTVRHLGDAHHETGRFEAAAACYQEAISLYRGDLKTAPLELANAIRSLALLKRHTGASEKAIRLWQEARDLYASVNVQEGFAECSRELARLGHVNA